MNRKLWCRRLACPADAGEDAWTTKREAKTVNVLLTLRVALRALRKNKLRAGLTVLGIVIGIAAVTAMVSVGQSATTSCRENSQGFGTNLIVVFSSSRRTGGVHQGQRTIRTLTAADCEAISASAAACWPPRRSSTPADRSSTATSIGTRAKWLAWDGLPDRPQLAAPPRRLLHRSRRQFRRPRCAWWATLSSKSSSKRPIPWDKTIRIKNIPFQIIGVLETKGPNLVATTRTTSSSPPTPRCGSGYRAPAFADVRLILVFGPLDGAHARCRR